MVSNVIGGMAERGRRPRAGTTMAARVGAAARIVAAAAIVLAAAVDQARAADRVRVGLGTEGLVHAPLYLAIDAGFMRQEQIDVELIQFRGGGAAMSGLASGAVDFCSCSIQNAINATAKGTGVTLVGTLAEQYASNVVVRPEVATRLRLTPASSLRDRLAALRGLRLAVSGTGGSADYLLRHLARQAGLSPERDLTIVYMSGNGPMLSAFSTRRIDGFALSSPTSDIAVRQYGGVMLFNMARGEYEGLRGYPSISLSAKHAWLRSRREVAHRFLRALAKADRLIGEEPVRARDLVRKRFASVNEEIYRAAWDNNVAAFPRNPRMKDGQVARAIAFLTEVAGTSAPGRAEQYFDNSYVDRAVASLNE